MIQIEKKTITARSRRMNYAKTASIGDAAAQQNKTTAIRSRSERDVYIETEGKITGYSKVNSRKRQFRRRVQWDARLMSNDGDGATTSVEHDPLGDMHSLS